MVAIRANRSPFEVNARSAVSRPAIQVPKGPLVTPRLPKKWCQYRIGILHKAARLWLFYHGALWRIRDGQRLMDVASVRHEIMRKPERCYPSSWLLSSSSAVPKANLASWWERGGRH
jgi:hypothetical protein